MSALEGRRRDLGTKDSHTTTLQFAYVEEQDVSDLTKGFCSFVCHARFVSRLVLSNVDLWDLSVFFK